MGCKRLRFVREKVLRGNYGNSSRPCGVNATVRNIRDVTGGNGGRQGGFRKQELGIRNQKRGRSFLSRFVWIEILWKGERLQILRLVRRGELSSEQIGDGVERDSCRGGFVGREHRGGGEGRGAVFLIELVHGGQQFGAGG